MLPKSCFNLEPSASFQHSLGVALLPWHGMSSTVLVLGHELSIAKAGFIRSASVQLANWALMIKTSQAASSYSPFLFLILGFHLQLPGDIKSEGEGVR